MRLGGAAIVIAVVAAGAVTAVGCFPDYEVGAGAGDGAVPDGTTKDGGTTDGAAGDGPGGQDAPASDGPGGSTPTGVEVAVGSLFACAVLVDGTVKCWGDNEFGQLGLGPEAGTGDVPHPTQVPGLTGVRALSAGSTHACALTFDGGVQCWGASVLVGRKGDSTSPGWVPGVSDVGQLAVGRAESCALTTDGRTLWCWSGLDSVVPGDPTKVPLPDAGPVKQVAIGENFVLLLMGDGTLAVFGDNQYTQLGLGAVDGGAFLDASAQVPYQAPMTIPGVGGVDLVGTQGAGGNTVCARKATGEVLCWGRNLNGNTGFNGSDVPSPTLSPPLQGIVAGFGVTMTTTCVLLTDGGVACMGSCDFDQCATPGVAGPTLYPIPLPGSVDRLWPGATSLCARKVEGGLVYCWGDDSHGQLGDGQDASTSGVVPVAW